MTNFANDLHIEGRIANDLHRASDQLILRHPAAMMAAARAERSKELARLLGKAARAITGFFRARRAAGKTKTATAEAARRRPANANQNDKHHLAA